MEVNLPDGLSEIEIHGTQNATAEVLGMDAPQLECCMDSDESNISPSNMLTAPILSINDDPPEVDPKNVMRSPPKLLPAVPISEMNRDETPKSVTKFLTGSMKNTPAALSIIDTPASLSGKSTRSTRSSIDPSFAAKQRSFLNKVHSALSSTRIEDTSSCDSDVERETGDLSDDESPKYVPISVTLKRTSSVLSNGLKRRREESSTSKKKDVMNLNGDTAPPASNNDEDAESSHSSAKKTCVALEQSINDGKRKDAFCWYCHREDKLFLTCASCPRVFHNRCLRRPSLSPGEGDWVCPECVTILRAENSETRSKALRMLSLDQLCDLLQFAVDRMKSCPGADVFNPPVNLVEFPSYKDYIVNPMHLSLLEKNIKRRMYGSTEAFVADASWIVHNCVIFNSYQSKLTSVAKNILRVCKQEMSEIENCPDCYKHAYTYEDNWFIKVCRKPHLLIWAKLKGFPYWPAKAMRVNSEGFAIDARFFGAHDRSWVPARDCYLYSEENPNHSVSNKQVQQLQPRKKSPRNNLDTCIEEVELHIQLLREEYGEFNYAPLKTSVNPKKLNEQLRTVLPLYKPILAFEVSKEITYSPRKFAKKEFAMKQQNVPKSVSPGNKPSNHATKALIKNENFSNFEVNLPDIGSEDKTELPISNSPKTSGVLAAMKSVEHKRRSESVTNTTGKESRTVAPSAAKIAEQRFKKKDARKIGLVDRLQEKLSQWLITSDSDNIKEGYDTSLMEVADQDANDIACSGQKDEIANATDQEESAPEDLESLARNQVEDLEQEQSLKVEESVKPNDSENFNHYTKAEKEHNNSSSKDLSNNEKQLKLFNLPKCQPKVLLQKLVLPITVAQEETTKSKFMHQPQVNADVENKPKDVENEPKHVENERKDVEIKPKDVENKPRDVENKPDDVDNLPDSRPHCDPKNGSCRSSPEIVLECVVEKVASLEDGTASDVSKDCKLSAPDQNEVQASGAIDVSKQVKNTEMSTVTLACPQDVEQKVEPISKEPTKRLVRLLSPEALGIVSNKSRPDTDAVMKKKVLIKPALLKTFIPIHQNRSVCLKKDDLKLQDIVDKKSSTAELKITVMDESTNQDEAQKKNAQVAFKSNADVCVDEPVATLASVLKKPVENKVTVVSASPLHLKSGVPINIAKPLSFGAVVDKIPPHIIHTKGLAMADGKVGIINQAGKFVQITQGATLTQSSTLSPSISPIVSRAVALTGSKKAAIVTVSSPSSLGNNIVRRYLPKAISLAPVAGGTSVLVTSRSNTPSVMPRISVGPLNPEAKLPLTTAPQETPTIAISSLRSISATPVTPSPPTATQSKSHILQAVGLVSKASVQLEPESVSSTTHASPSPAQNKSPGAQDPTPVSPASLELQSTCNEVAKVSSTEAQQSLLLNDQSHKTKPLGVGPSTSNLHLKATKLTDMFMTCMQDYLRDMGSMGNMEAQVRCLQLDLEHIQWRHKQEMDELRHNTDLFIAEIRDSLKVEAQRAVAEAMKIARAEKDAAVAATKQRQWCAFCGKEALFYCCWNTSYCDFKCQESHWPAHSVTCMQGLTSSEDRSAGKVEEKSQDEMRVSDYP